MTTAEETLARLRAGNLRFAEGRAGRWLEDLENRRRETPELQRPVATVLGCSDSRVPVEIVFDQALGDLFVVRVAVNGAGPAQVASLRFAVERLDVPLVLVPGHSGCRAVRACLQDLEGRPGDLGAILDPIRRVVRVVKKASPGARPEELEARSVSANVAAAVKAVRGKMNLLGGAGRRTGVTVAGAVYDLGTGGVEFLDEGEERVSAGRGIPR